MRFTRLLVLAAIPATLAGCKSAPTPSASKTEEIRKQIETLHVQYRKDCINAPYKQIEASKDQCKAQRVHLDDVADSLQKAEQADQAKGAGR